MARHYTILCIDDKGNPVRETLISKRSIRFFATFILSLLFVIGSGAYHYTRLHNAVADKAELLASLEHQKSEIESQRSQIQSFAREIDQLKASLLTLNEFENKIRIVANLEHKTDQASLFAVGGSMPDDLDPNMPLNQDHDRLMRNMHTQMEQIQMASSVQSDSFGKLLKSL